METTFFLVYWMLVGAMFIALKNIAAGDDPPKTKTVNEEPNLTNRFTNIDGLIEPSAFLEYDEIEIYCQDLPDDDVYDSQIRILVKNKKVQKEYHYFFHQQNQYWTVAESHSAAKEIVKRNQAVYLDLNKLRAYFQSENAKKVVYRQID